MKKKQKRIITYATLLVIVIFIIGLYVFIKSASAVDFYINNKKMNSIEQKVEYKKIMDFSPKKIKLTAKLDGKDITNKIKYNKLNSIKLKSYIIKYEVENCTFEYKAKIVDTTKPVIKANDQLHVIVNSKFDNSMLDISASDNFDKDLSAKVKVSGNVDLSKVGTYKLKLIVEDTSGNKRTMEISVIVDEQVVETPPVIKSELNEISNPTDIGAMVNKWNVLPDGWEPNDLELIANNIGGTYYLRSEAANAWNDMMSAAKNDGLLINVVSAYRSQSYQSTLYNNYYNNDPLNADIYSAKPRRSEHELGLAIDISNDNQLHEDLGDTDIGRWMDKNAAKFGWFMRYPSGKTNITGYMFEAWHYRYIGKETAQKIKDSSKTLEEFYE